MQSDCAVTFAPCHDEQKSPQPPSSWQSPAPIGAYQGDDNATGYFLVASLIAIAAALWVILPRIRRPGLGSLGILSIVSLLVFWLGFPPVLAGATVVLALVARQQQSEVGKTNAALVLAALAVIAAVVVAFVG
jgi:hypothetical protein